MKLKELLKVMAAAQEVTIISYEREDEEYKAYIAHSGKSEDCPFKYIERRVIYFSAREDVIKIFIKARG